jgi:hypothetical protein
LWCKRGGRFEAELWLCIIRYVVYLSAAVGVSECSRRQRGKGPVNNGWNATTPAPHTGQENKEQR